MGFSKYTVYKNDDKQFTKGLFKCGVCGKSVLFDSKNRSYACDGRKKGKCSQGYIKEGILESQLGAFVADIQRIIRKSQVIKDLKVELRKTMTTLRKKWTDLEIELAKEAKAIKLALGSELKGLRSEVDNARQLNQERVNTQRRFEEANELYGGILALWALSNHYKDEPFFLTLYFQAIVISDKTVVEVEFSPGVDHLVHLAVNEHELKVATSIRSCQSPIIDAGLINVLDQLIQLQNSTIIWRKPSLKTTLRHSDGFDHQTFGERLFQRVFMFINRFGPFKRAWENFEHPSERERALEFAEYLENPPSLYEGGSPARIQAQAAIKVLEYQIKELEWLLKHRPSYYQLYYEWEDQTRHLIGKIFRFKSDPYRGFIEKTDLLGFALAGNAKRIMRFLETENVKNEYLDTLIVSLGARQRKRLKHSRH